MNPETKQKWTPRRIARELLITIIIIIVMANAISYFKRPELSPQKLPDIKAPLIDKTDFSTAKAAGEPLMLHFWATWCPTCKAEAGNIDWIANLFPVLSIAVKSGSDTQLAAYMSEHTLSFKVLNDQDGTLARKFSVSVYPTTFIYDSAGNLAFTEVGYTSSIGLLFRMWWVK